jgi:hypothetical protein
MNGHPHRLLAHTDRCEDVTQWVHIYTDVYQCVCCGQHKSITQLTLVTKGGRL